MSESFSSLSNNDTMMMIILISVIGVVALISIAVNILYLLSLYRNLKMIEPNRREMEPSYVFFNLIPLFGLGWMVYTALKIADSNINEGRVRNCAEVADGLKSIGLTYAILSICSIIPYLGSLAALAGLVFWIIHWVKIADLNRIYRNNPNPLTGIGTTSS